RRRAQSRVYPARRRARPRPGLWRAPPAAPGGGCEWEISRKGPAAGSHKVSMRWRYNPQETTMTLKVLTASIAALALVGAALPTTPVFAQDRGGSHGGGGHGGGSHGGGGN